MSFRELRNLTEMLRALGYPRPVSMENFRKPNFELVSDMLYWMVKKYDPSAHVGEEIDTEDDRIEFLAQVVAEMQAKARLRLNAKKLYAADGFAVKELLKLARVLYEASQIDVSRLEGDSPDDDDDVSVKSLLGSRVKDPKATRQLASDITLAGAKLHDLLEAELDVRDARQQAIRFLDALATNSENSSEQKYIERSIKDILAGMHESLETSERQCVELEAEDKALAAKIKKAQTDLERSEKRLKSLHNVRPAFMDEYEKLEKELERQYAVYCERFRNLDYLQRELDLHNARERKQLAENDRSLKKLQKKFRDDELAILRGEQEDQVDGSGLDAGDNNAGRKASNGDGRRANNGGNQRTAGAASSSKAAARRDAESESESGSGSDEDEEDEDVDDSTDESTSGGRGAAGGGKTSANANANDDAGSDSDEVSLADSGELIDNDDGSGSEAGHSGEDASGSGSGGGSGSETNSDSDQDF